MQCVDRHSFVPSYSNHQKRLSLMSSQSGPANPYESPATSEVSRYDRRVLLIYLSMRDKPPTYLRLFARMIPSYLILCSVPILAFMGVMVLRSTIWVIPLLAGVLFVGFLLGVLTRDLGIFRRTILIWPVLSDIINWERVEQLLDDSSLDDGNS